MKVLHIVNDFCGSKVHSELYKRLDSIGVNQVIYNPIRDNKLYGKNSFEGKGTKIFYSYVIKPYHKFLYYTKKTKLFSDLQSKIDVSDIDLCHATTTFSDGAIAYDLFKKYGIPYIVAVRDTDVNGFMNFLPHTWLNGVKILLNAQKIIFISEGLKRKFQNHIIIRPILNRINKKIVLIPNGIDDFYLNNIYREVNFNNKIIYIGTFSNRKNVVRLCNAVLRLKKDIGFENTVLTLVGGGNNKTHTIEKIISKHPESFNYIGKENDKQKICNLLRENSMFAMPSIHETFGLVYIEALSQNLPVLYTKGQGIDGLFDETVGISVNPLSVKDIYLAIKKILSNRNSYSNRNVDFEIFNWSNIANIYNALYNAILNQK